HGFRGATNRASGAISSRSSRWRYRTKVQCPCISQCALDRGQKRRSGDWLPQIRDGAGAPGVFLGFAVLMRGDENDRGSRAVGDERAVQLETGHVTQMYIDHEASGAPGEP